MKNLYKYALLLFLSVLITNCNSDDDNNGLGTADVESGWVEFTSASSTITIITDVLEIPVEVNVPVFAEGLNISYTFEAVEGDFNQITSGSGGVLFVDPADNNRLPTLDLAFSNVATISEQVVFDVVLTAVDKGSVKVGVDDTSITRFRISTPCPLDVAAIEGVYDVAEVFTSGTNEGLTFAGVFDQSYQVEISIDPNDLTQTIFFINNSIGFNTYFVDGTTVAFDTCSGTVVFSDPLNLAGFEDMTVETTSYTESPTVITADGPLGNFGPYQFVLTKQ
jgi:hypothetical protein